MLQNAKRSRIPSSRRSADYGTRALIGPPRGDAISLHTTATKFVLSCGCVAILPEVSGPKYRWNRFVPATNRKCGSEGVSHSSREDAVSWMLLIHRAGRPGILLIHELQLNKAGLIIQHETGEPQSARLLPFSAACEIVSTCLSCRGICISRSAAGRNLYGLLASPYRDKFSNCILPCLLLFSL